MIKTRSRLRGLLVATLLLTAASALCSSALGAFAAIGWFAALAFSGTALALLIVIRTRH